MILREGKTPSGEEVRTVLKHVIKRIRRHWPKVHILVRGDTHYGRDEAMEWCEETRGIDYVFGFAGNDVLQALTREAADAMAVQRALSGKTEAARLQGLSLRRKELGPGAALGGPHRGNPQGTGCPLCRHLAQGRRQASLRDPLLRAGKCRELHQVHKSQLASDRTSCRDPKANQFRLILHTAAYWLLLAMRSRRTHALAVVRTAEFATSAFV